MGGSQSCQKTTEAQVEGDLQAALLSTANTLSPSFDLPDNYSNLQDCIQAIAEAEFKNNFSYDWGTAGYPTVSPPQIDTDNPREVALPDYCLIKGTTAISDAVRDYLQKATDPIKDQLPSWMIDNAILDLNGLIDNLAAYPIDNNWHVDTRSFHYDATDTAGSETDSYRLDISICYTNAFLSEDSVNVTWRIFSFVGIYYTIKSPKVVTLNALETDAYTAASKLPSVDQGTITSNADLQVALLQYGSQLFQDKWHYQYNTPGSDPPDLAKNISNPMNSFNTYLAYFQTKTIDDQTMDNYVDTFIMNGYPINDPGKKAAIKGAIKNTFETLVAGGDPNQWNYNYIDQTYGLNQASVQPVHLNGIFIAWTGSQQLDDSSWVDVIYILWMGELYDLDEDPIFQDMTRELMVNIPNVNPDVVPSGNISPQAFHDAVEAYNISQFNAKAHEPFPTGPPSDHTTAKWDVFFEFDHWYPTDAEIQDQIKLNIFGPDGGDLKHCQADVYQWLVTIFEKLAGDTQSKDPNQWYCNFMTKNFPYTSNGVDYTLAAESSWAYANGTKTEDTHGDENIQHFYLHVLLFLKGSKDDDDNGGDIV